MAHNAGALPTTVAAVPKSIIKLLRAGIVTAPLAVLAAAAPIAAAGAAGAAAGPLIYTYQQQRECALWLVVFAVVSGR